MSVFDPGSFLCSIGLKQRQHSLLQAAALECSLLCQRHTYSLTVPILPLAWYSIVYNYIGAEGASTLAAILKETQIQELECAAPPERSL